MEVFIIGVVIAFALLMASRAGSSRQDQQPVVVMVSQPEYQGGRFFSNVIALGVFLALVYGIRIVVGG